MTRIQYQDMDDKPLMRPSLLAVSAEIEKRLAEEDRQIEAFGLKDLLPDIPKDYISLTLEQKNRRMNRGPVTQAGMLEAYRRGYRAARLEGIRLGLGAAERAIQGLHDYGDLSREIALEDASMAVCALDPDTIAREAVLDQLTREAQAQNMGHDPNDAKENAR